MPCRGGTIKTGPVRFERVVALCLSPLGDALFATPAVRALRYNLPQARIVILANQMGAEVFKNNPYRIEVVNCSDQWDLLKKLVEVRKCGFDLALGLSQIGSFFTRFCGTPFRSDFFSISEKKNLSVVKLCLDVLAQAGLAVNTFETEFWLRETDQEKVGLFLKKERCDSEKPLLAVHCGGHYFIRKRWPLLNYLRLIEAIIADGTYQVILVGGREDMQDAALIQSLLPEVINTTGRLSLGETAALLKRCKLLIANDSGPLHLGAALATPTIGLFGPTTPEQFFPYRRPGHRYLYKKLSCSPCYRFGGGLWQYVPRCSKAYCMEEIEVGEVLELVLDQSMTAMNAKLR